MKNGVKPHSPSSSFFSLLSGWMQQGVESFFATQRILVDLAMRQNASAMRGLRDRFSDPEYSPVAILTELATEATASFTEAQRILLSLAQQETDIMASGMKERVGTYPAAMAMTDLVTRSIETFIDMQQEFLKITSKHTMNWLEAGKAGKGYTGNHLVEAAREAMENFVHAQKKFLDVIAEETTKATSGKAVAGKKMTRTELSDLAHKATHSFIDAQKKLLDVVGQQMNVNLKVASRTMGMMTPFRMLPMANLTGEGVKNFVDAEKALIDSVIKPRNGKTARMPRRAKRPARKVEAAQAAHV